MKIIKYKFLSTENMLIDKEFRCSEENLNANEAIAKAESYNGVYTIEDDGKPETYNPTQLDRIEAQATYTAMMTNTLLEV